MAPECLLGFETFQTIQELDDVTYVSKSNCAKRPFRSVNPFKSLVRASVRDIFSWFLRRGYNYGARTASNAACIFSEKVSTVFFKTEKNWKKHLTFGDYRLTMASAGTSFWTSFWTFLDPFFGKKTKKMRKVTFIFQARDDQIWWLHVTCLAGC